MIKSLHPCVEAIFNIHYLNSKFSLSENTENRNFRRERHCNVLNINLSEVPEDDKLLKEI